MTRFSNFSDEELDAMEEAFCNEGLKSLVFEIRRERRYREREAVLDKIKTELTQSIQNGTLKIESGNKELFRILDNYKSESGVEE